MSPTVPIATKSVDGKAPSSPTQQQVREASLQALRRKVSSCEAQHHAEEAQVVSSGVPALDALLPAGGFRFGSLIEFLEAGPGSGVGTWTLSLAGHVVRMAGVSSWESGETTGSTCVVVDSQRQFYPPVAAALGMDLRRLIVLQPNASETIWVLDQVLRCPDVAAVWTRLPRIAPRDFRRLQLAAEDGRTLGLFLRPQAVAGQPTWSTLQLAVRPVATPAGRAGKSAQRFWQLEVLRCRGGTPGANALVTVPQRSGSLG